MMSLTGGSDSQTESSHDLGLSFSTLIDPVVWARLQAMDPDGSHGLIPRVVEAFHVSLERITQDLQTALATKNAHGIRVAAHTLKSSSASLGATSLAALCAELEHDCKDDLPEQLPQRVAHLLSQTADVSRALHLRRASQTGTP